jgi:hypothetical protein
MTERGELPTLEQVEAWIGSEAYGFWTQITCLIEQTYPDVFTPEWLFGGKKHGWSLRYKKGKSFCTLVPERQRFALLIVFGAEERAKVETIRQELSERTLGEYDAAATYHDGKWLLLDVDTSDRVADVARLLLVKRRPPRMKKST